MSTEFWSCPVLMLRMQENERKRNLAEVEREARELQPLVQRGTLLSLLLVTHLTPCLVLVHFRLRRAVNQMCSEMKIPLVYSLGFERVRTQLSDDFQLTHAVVNVLTPQKVLKAQLHAAEFKLTCERMYAPPASSCCPPHR